MGTAPIFANAPIVGTGIVPATLDTSLTAPTNQTTLTFSTAIGSSGAKIEQVDVIGLGTTVAGVLNTFLYDGSTYHLFDQWLISAVTSSTTAVAFRASRQYPNLIIPSSWSFRITNTIAGNQSLLEVNAYGANF